MPPLRTQTLLLKNEAETAKLASSIAKHSQNGDVILLSGEIGAGKSCFARAFIRTIVNNPHEDVPSPTFTLVQTYEALHVEIWHCDLYRLTSPDQAIELGLENAFEHAICLVEWPDRLGDLEPNSALRLSFLAEETTHSVTITDSTKTGILDLLDLHNE